jgi:hypothetical protein
MSPTDPKIQPAQIEDTPSRLELSPEASPQPVGEPPQPFETRILLRILLGPQGLRAGWSVLAFSLLFGLFTSFVGFAFFHLNLVSGKSDFSASSAFFSELVSFLAMVAAAAVVAHRSAALAAFCRRPHCRVHRALCPHRRPRLGRLA